MKTRRIVSFLLAVLMTVSCMSLSTLTVGAADTAKNATIQVGNATVTAGSRVTLDVTIEDNPGILGMTLYVGYDESKAALVAVENGDALSGMTFTTPRDLSDGCTLPWDAEKVNPEDINDGVIVRLTFEVAESAKAGDSIPVSLTYHAGAIIDNDLNPLTVNIENGAIKVLDYVPGDLNEDGIINTTDVVWLRRYIAGGYGVTIQEAAGDVNADGTLNTTDVVYIRRFVAGGYGVVLKPGKHVHTEVIDATKAPTCTETGLTEGKHCAKCGEVLVKQETVPAKGHSFANGVCSVCGKEELNFGGKTVRVLYWQDVERIEFDVPELTGDLIGDALYSRNATVEDKLNMKLDWVGANGNYNNQAYFINVIQNNFYAGGAELFDIYAGYSMSAATIALSGLSRDLSEISTIHFDKPWWPASLKEENSIGGSLYYCTGDISTNMLNMMYCTYFNRDLAKDLNVGNLYDTVEDGHWTIDKMAELSANAFADLNGNGVRDTDDRYGIGLGSNIHFDAFFTGSDLHTIEKDANDLPYVSESFASEKNTDLLEKMVDIFHKSEYSAFAATISGWSNKPFAEGRVLFIVDRAYVLTTAAFANANVNVGMLPVPKFDAEQDSYVTTMAFPFTTYSVSSALSEDRAKMAGAALESLCEESYRQVTPAWFHSYFGYAYHNGGDDAHMFDLVRNNIRIEMGRVFSTPLKNITYSSFRNAANNGNTNWSSIIKAESRVLSKLLDSVVNAILGTDHSSHTHTVSTWTVTKPATCNESGTRIGTCATCGKTVTESIEKTAHVYVNGSCSACGKAEIKPGTIIFEETFDYPNDNDTESVLNTIGWTKLTKEKDGVYNETDGEFAIIDGRLYYDNWDAEGQAEGDTRVRGKDGYYQIDMLNQEYMKQFVAEKYTLQYDLEYIDSKNISRYAVIITECSADGQCYNSFHFRIGGYANNQAHFYGSWKTYDAFDPATDLYCASTATNAEQAATKGTPIGFKLLGKYYDATNEIHMFKNVPVTIRQQWDPEMGHHVYMKTADMKYFVKVAEPSVNADGPMYVGSWDGYAVQFKFGATIDGYIDNIMMWTGWGDMLKDGHYINGKWTVETESTCITHGKEYAVCTKCGEKVYRELPLSDHKATNWKQTTAPTCQTPGVESGTCICGTVLTREVKKIEHTFVGENCTQCGRGYNYDLKFSKYTSNNVPYYSVTGIGTCTDAEIYIPASIDGIPVTEIGSSAFSGNTQITKVVIPSSVTTTYGQAFYNCTNLSVVILPETLTTIYYNDFTNLSPEAYTVEANGGKYLGTATNPYFLLVDVESRSDVTSFVTNPAAKLIGYEAFFNCDYLKSIVISEGAERIMSYAFETCDALTSVSLPSTVTYLDTYLFARSNALTEIRVAAGNPVFKSVNNCIIRKDTKAVVAGCISSVIPTDGSVTAIDAYAFYDLGITGITIPEGITKIGNYAFQNCNKLTEIEIPASVTQIGTAPFRYCTSLSAIRVAKGNTAFLAENNCLIKISNGGLIAVGNKVKTIPDGVKRIESRVFYNRDDLTEIMIPDSVTYVGMYAFADCDYLTEIVIPDSVTSTGTYVFDSCDRLEKVTLSASMKTVANYTFRNCSKLTEVTIPASVTSIGNYVFQNCTALKTVYYGGTAEQWAKVSIGSNNAPLQNAEIKTTNHKYTNWTQTKAPTCTEVGVEKAICDCGCGTVQTREIPRTHTFVGENCTQCGRGYNYDLNFSKYTNKNNGVVTEDYRVTGIGTCTDAEIYIPASIDGIPVTQIGSSAFSGNTQITKVVIPSGVTTVNSSAFYNCTNLADVILPETLTAVNYNSFANLSPDAYTVDENGGKYLGTATNTYFLLVDVESRSDVTSFVTNSAAKLIGYEAFSNCDYLKSIVISEGAERIMSYAFETCDALTSVSLPSTVTYLDNRLFDRSNALTEIRVAAGNPVFKSVNNCIIHKDTKAVVAGCISSVIPTDGSVTAIDAYAFANLDITGITIPEGITKIGNYAFHNCNKLTEIEIPASVTQIGTTPFRSCTSLSAIRVAKGNTAFRAENNCLINLSNSGLIAVGNKVKTIPDGVKRIESQVFFNCNDLTEITIPNSVTYIGAEAFWSCQNLTEIVIPDSVISTEHHVFAYCDKLEKVTLSASMKSINAELFDDCKALTEITIPVSVTSIGNGAFQNCTALKTVYYGGTAEQWAKVKIGANNGNLSGATIHFAAPVAIQTAADFAAMMPGGEYYLANDITIDTTWNLKMPISFTYADNYAFTGSLDGKGHTITTSVPLFANFAGTIKNLTIEGEITNNMIDGNLAHGAAIGMWTNGEAYFYNITNKANITGSKSTGALIGYGATGSKIVAENCVNYGNFDCSDQIGGFFGYVQDYEVTIINCVNNGDLTTANYGGGIIGRFGRDAANVANGSKVVIADCTNNGKVVSAKGQTGGILGYLIGGAEIYNCVNNGEVINKIGAAGGIFGSTGDKADTTTVYIENCTNYGVVKGVTYIGGIVARVGRSAQSTIGSYRVVNCTNYGDVRATATGDTAIYAGGISAYAWGSSISEGQLPNGTVGNINYGKIAVDATTVTSKAIFVGGILGYVNGANYEIKNNINAGEIAVAGGTNNTVALIGYNKNIGSVENGKFANNYALAVGETVVAYAGDPVIGTFAPVVETVAMAFTIEQLAAGEIAYLKEIGFVLK